jgi:sRNA-binding protein
MTSQRGIERGRGAKESGQQLAVLRAKWPLAFPIKPRDVRPLAASVVGEIAAAMSWSVAYTRGVLFVWKMGPVYCQAVLSHDHRITLDGTPAEAVDAAAKELATKRLVQIAERKAAKAVKAAEAAPLAVMKPEPKPAGPTEAPAPLRNRVRASLLRRGDGAG